VGESLVTIRGCAPFFEEYFEPSMAVAISTTFWKSNSKEFIAMCATDNCNTASNLKTGF